MFFKNFLIFFLVISNVFFSSTLRIEFIIKNRITKKCQKLIQESKFSKNRFLIFGKQYKIFRIEEDKLKENLDKTLHFQKKLFYIQFGSNVIVLEKFKDILFVKKIINEKYIFIPKKLKLSYHLKDFKKLKLKQFSYYIKKKLCALYWIKGKGCDRKRYYTITNKKNCFFLHGVGIKNSEKTKDNFPYYWGYINSYLKETCESFYFIVEETKFRGWENKMLNNNIVEKIKNILKNNKLENVIMYTHSMGNLIFANILKNKMLKMGKGSYWISINPPFRGSKASEFLQLVCDNQHISFMREIAQIMDYCYYDNIKKRYIVYPAYLSLETTKDYKSLEKIINKYVNKVLCGNSSFGIFSKYSIPLYLLNRVVDFNTTNDGMVSTQSCIIMNKTKIEEINHADGTCRNGGSYFESTNPCMFYLL